MHSRLEIRRNQVASTRRPSQDQLRDALRRGDELIAREAAKSAARRARLERLRVRWPFVSALLTTILLAAVSR